MSDWRSIAMLASEMNQQALSPFTRVSDHFHVSGYLHSRNSHMQAILRVVEALKDFDAHLAEVHILAIWASKFCPCARGAAM